MNSKLFSQKALALVGEAHKRMIDGLPKCEGNKIENADNDAERAHLKRWANSTEIDKDVEAYGKDLFS